MSFLANCQLGGDEMRSKCKTYHMKFLILFILFALVASSCNKGDDSNDDSNSLFTTTNTSFSELDLTQINNGDLFIMNLDVDVEAKDLTIDLNGDGIKDLKLTGSDYNSWSGGNTLGSSVLLLQTLSPNTFVLGDSISDTTFVMNSIDTN
jgi:hypothetical protein